MIKKVTEYAKNLNMFQENDYVVAGVSGGADSVCLLLMLVEIQKSIPFSIHVVHINHGIREEAKDDAAYVESLCDKYGIPFTIVNEDVEELARQQHISTEEAGRNVRYQAFYSTLEKYANGRNGKIAIAHNKNDSCETFLFNLFRGSGLKGLTGISSVRDNIVRPLLCLTRAEIEEYLDKNNISYCIDRTNYEDNYTRNRIRHHILPAACEMVSQAALDHIKDASDKINDAWELLNDMTKEGYDTCVIFDEKGYHINKEAWQNLHKTIRGYVLYEVIAKAAGSRKDLESVHVEQLEELMEKQCGRSIDLPYGLCAAMEYAGICVSDKKDEINTDITQIYYEIGEREKKLLEEGNEVVFELSEDESISFRILDSVPQENKNDNSCNDNGKNIPSKPYTKWFDYDTIKDNIVVRTRQSGDYLTVNSSNQRQTLKAFFVNEKIPKDERDHIILVTELSHCLWIVGKRISSYYKVSERTKNILEINYRGGVKEWLNM